MYITLLHRMCHHNTDFECLFQFETENDTEGFCPFKLEMMTPLLCFAYIKPHIV